MSIRAGIAALNKRLEQVKSEAFSVVGLCERMRKLRAENAGSAGPVAQHDLESSFATLEPGSLAHQMTAQRIHNLRERANP